MASSRASLSPCSESHECSADIPKRWCWEWDQQGYPWGLQVLGKSGRFPTPPIADTVSSRAVQNLSEDHGDQWLTALIGRMGGFACEHLWDHLWELPGIHRRILLGTGTYGLVPIGGSKGKGSLSDCCFCHFIHTYRWQRRKRVSREKALVAH